MNGSSAQVRLDHAERLLGGNSLGSAWPRWVVWLIRLAIEHELDDLWVRRSSAVVDCKRRSQLLALGVFLDSETQHRVSELWNALSRAAHHHHYELAPTGAELRSWLSEARLLCAHLEDRA